MANSKGNMEIMDVLSSIRRLVSEDRRIPAADRAEPTLRGPGTEAEQVPGGGEVRHPDVPVADAPADGATLVSDHHEADPLQAEAELAALANGAATRAGENRFVLTAALRVGEEEGGPDDATADKALPLPLRARPDDVPEKPARDLASLEDTIAELEAAVAGIEEEFEPDGGDKPAHAELTSVGPMPGWPVAERAVPVSGGFQGIMAGFESMPMGDDRLDQPITGDATIPATRRRDDRLDGTGLGGGFFRASARSGDNMPEVTEAAIAEVALSEPDVTLALNEQSPDREAVAEAPVVAGDEPDQSPPQDEATGEEERAYSRPIILRSRATEPDPEPVVEADLPEAHQEPLTGPVGAALPPEDDLTAEERDLDGTQDSDLFDPLADADFDIDTLRDMVAEIVREELRGTLGERITRNLRALVRREIERALVAEGLKRD